MRITSVSSSPGGDVMSRMPSARVEDCASDSNRRRSGDGAVATTPATVIGASRRRTATAVVSPARTVTASCTERYPTPRTSRRQVPGATGDRKKRPDESVSVRKPCPSRSTAASLTGVPASERTVPATAPASLAPGAPCPRAAVATAVERTSANRAATLAFLAMSPEVTCPACGAKGAGKFCPDCGAAVAPRGRTGVPHSAGSRDPLPWIITGVAVLAVSATLVVIATRTGNPATPTATDPASAPATTDLSAMSPREAADRLYERVARADEAGDTANVQFFGPMAINAYANVTPLDPDARLHLGLIQLALGNPDGAAAQADSIRRESRTHLFASLLDIRTAEARSDAAAAARALAAFLRNYDAERARRLDEYDQHNPILLAAKNQAERNR